MIRLVESWELSLCGDIVAKKLSTVRQKYYELSDQVHDRLIVCRIELSNFIRLYANVILRIQSGMITICIGHVFDLSQTSWIL
jgi:hypothetical protein